MKGRIVHDPNRFGPAVVWPIIVSGSVMRCALLFAGCRNMNLTFTSLSPEYTHLLSLTCALLARREVDATATRLLGYIKQYYAAKPVKKPAFQQYGLPQSGGEKAGLRYSGSYFGNGDPLTLLSRRRDVPRGRGPFSSFEAGLLSILCTTTT